MSDSEVGDGGGTADQDPDRSANEALGRKVRELLAAAGAISRGTASPGEESWQLGRLIRAYVRIEDPRIRTEISSLVEAIGLFQADGPPLPRR